MPTIFDIIEAFQRMKESERRLGDIQTQASIAEPFALTQARRTLPMEQPTNEHLPLTPEIVPPQRMSRESAASRFGAPMEQPREPSAQMMAAQRFGAPMEQEPVPNAQAIMAALSGNTPSQEPTMNMGGGGGGGGGTDYASIAMNRFGDA